VRWPVAAELGGVGEGEEDGGEGKERKGNEYRYPVAKMMASMFVSILPSSNSSARLPRESVVGRKHFMEGTACRVVVSGGGVAGLGFVDGWLLRVECRSGGAQTGSICDAMSRPEYPEPMTRTFCDRLGLALVRWREGGVLPWCLFGFVLWPR